MQEFDVFRVLEGIRNV